MSIVMAVNVWESTNQLTVDERNELNEYMDRMYRLVHAKYEHAHYCELVTGLWNSCDCGAEQEMEDALTKIRYTWLKRRGKYIKLM